MSSRAVVVAFVAFMAVPSLFAADDEIRCAQEANSATAPEAPETLSALFATQPDVLTLPGGMMVTHAQVRMVMLVRRAEDGTLVYSCVTSTEGADSFLHPKLRALDNSREQER